MIALQGYFGYSLALGMFAAVNPCGFVMLPAYLMYYLGLEGSQPGSQRASIVRALVVSVATSSGFIAVFLVVGTISRLFTSVIQDKAKYASLLIGIAMVVLGCFMLAGWRPKFALPGMNAGVQRAQTFRSMFGFGIAYAVASLGCTIPLLIGNVFGSFSTKGYVSGVLSTVLYGVGMALMVTALTVTLAFASGGLLRVLRGALKYMDRIASVFLIATGMYLTWYWYSTITDRGSDNVTDRVVGWQDTLISRLEDIGRTRLAVILAIPIVVSVLYLSVTRERRASGGPDDSGAPIDAASTSSPQRVSG